MSPAEFRVRTGRNLIEGYDTMCQGLAGSVTLKTLAFVLLWGFERVAQELERIAENGVAE